MAYEKTNWQDTLRDAQGNVIQKGTPLNAQALGKIEEGIVQAEQKIDTEISQVAQQLAQNTEEISLRGVRPESFGANGDNGDDTVALQQAINHANTLGTHLLLSKKYSFTNLKFPAGIVIRGLKRAVTGLKHIGGGVAIQSGASGNNLYADVSNISIELNANTTIGLDLQRMAHFTLDKVTVFGNGCIGSAVKAGMTTEFSHAGYYNIVKDVYINGASNRDAPEKTLQYGFELVNSANSTMFIGGRFDYVKEPILGGEGTNNNTFLGVSFEHFNTAIKTYGRSYNAYGCRFELPIGSTDGVGMNILGGGFYNGLMGCHFQHVSQKVRDESTSKLNTYFADAVGNVQELILNNYPLKKAKTIGLEPQSTYTANEEGSLIYYGSGYSSGSQGLYFNDRGSRKQLKALERGTSVNRPSNVPIGHEYFNTTLSKNEWWDGTKWVSSPMNLEGNGSPEGIISAGRSTFYNDITSGKLYYKVSASGNTGWKEVTLV